jgi:hypothetical protein
MPCYHPAAALHNGSLLDDLQKDFDRVGQYLADLLKPEASAPDPPEGETSGTAPPTPQAPVPPVGEQLELI